MHTQPQPLPRLLKVTRRVGRSVESFAAETGDAWRCRAFAQYRRCEAWRWRNGSGGPPFGAGTGPKDLRSSSGPLRSKGSSIGDSPLPTTQGQMWSNRKPTTSRRQRAAPQDGRLAHG